ncbi:MAG: MotA/TolQ/ExbB proton channel family protein [Planctomycetes bacterium]|nr:MotA/TolQ/ExbB proton channel family protein [Planctomycetota bacterium]
MSKPNNIAAALFRSPVLWGGLATVVFYALIRKGLIGGEFVQRYFASHPVEYVATTMFLVAMAALAIKLIDISAQTAALGKFHLDREPDGQHTVDDCQPLLEQLAQVPPRLQEGYLIRRLREALVYVWRKGDANTLDDELRHLADVDAYRSHDSYSLVRIIIWAIPILGFLGTVIGITLAVAKLSPQQIETSITEVTAGLGVAFDTTALSLSLSIVLMFAMYLTTRIETRLVADVDAKVSAEMVGRFEQIGSGGDGQLALLRRMTDQVVHSSERLVAGQAEIWKSTIDEAHARWQNLSGETAEQLQQTFCNSLNEALGDHTRAMTNQQEQLIRQGEMLLKVVEATGQVKQLETALNENLSALAGSHDFSKTVISLSAAINLLTARLDDGGRHTTRVDLSDDQPRESAA